MNFEPGEKQDYLDQIKEHARARAFALRDVETLTDFLKEEIRDAIAAGILSELGAHKLTGISRNTIRTWVGKT